MNVSTALTLQDEDISLFCELSDEEAFALIVKWGHRACRPILTLWR